MGLSTGLENVNVLFTGLYCPSKNIVQIPVHKRAVMRLFVQVLAAVLV